MRMLNTLAWVHFGYGALTVLLGAPLLGLGVLETDGGVFFLTAGFLLLLKGAASLVLWRALRRPRPWSRMLGIGVSVLDLPLFPVGTGIGILGLTVLSEPEVRACLAGHRRLEPPAMPLAIQG